MAGSFDWSRYAIGGATRPDSFSGMQPGFRSSLEAMFADAPAELGLQVGSGFRSIERQRQLWEASDKSGRMVARPGGSRHNHGDAADLSAGGLRLDKASPAAREWVHANAEKYGLTFPMSYEPWHVEAIGARGGKGSATAMAPDAAPKTGAAAAIDNIAPTGGSPSGGDMQRNYRADALEASNGGRRLVGGPSTQAAGPVLEIGKMQSTELEDALIARQLANSGNIDSPWEAIGGLAQLWAAKSVKDQKTQENAAAFASALNGGGFDPDVAALAKLGGDQDALVQAVTLQSQRRMQAEDRAWRQDERTYQRGRDGVEDQRFQQRRDWQLQDRQSERDNAVSDYRTKAEIDREFTAPPSGYRRTDAGGLEPIPGGPNDRAANFKPDISSVYDEQGREQKGYFDAAGNWTTIGGAKAPSNANGMSVTMPDGTVVQTGGSKPFTEGQSKDNVFSTRARGALPTLNEKAGNLARYGQKMMDGDPTGIVRGSFQDPEYQVARTSADEFLQAILRKDTGAAITAPEQELYGKTYLPQPGDTKEAMTYKEGARERAIAAIEAGMSPSQMVAQERALAAAAKKPDAGKTDYRDKYGLE